MLTIVSSIPTEEIENNQPSMEKNAIDPKSLHILGNNSSKVVDENGEHPVVYHGTMNGMFYSFAGALSITTMP